MLVEAVNDGVTLDSLLGYAPDPGEAFPYPEPIVDRIASMTATELLVTYERYVLFGT